MFLDQHFCGASSKDEFFTVSGYWLATGQNLNF